MTYTHSDSETIYIGSEILMKALLEEKVEVIFGSPSAAILQDNDSFHKDIKPILLKHEQATIHAADGYARASGKVGVAFIQAGSGITNAITGIATAQMDSVPLVIFYQESTCTKGWNRRHDLNVFGMTTPIIKHHFRIEEISSLEKILKRSFFIAKEGRPGTVIVEIPGKIFIEKAPYKNLKLNGDYKKELSISNRQLTLVKEAISIAKRPILLVGGGVTIAGASLLVKKLAENANIPVVSTLMAIGAFPCSHPLYLGMLGMHGTFAANKAVHQSDLLICLGARFSDRVTGRKSGFSPKSKKIQIDIDPSEINKNIHIDFPIVGDVKAILGQINEVVLPGDTQAWVKDVSEWQRTSQRFANSKSELKPQQVIQLLDRYSDGRTIVATDVGQHQIWTALYYKFNHPRLLLTSGGLGTMGFGLPAAIGAALMDRGRDVLCISGDGSFQMNYQELITIAKYKLPVKIAILRNGYLGMVRQWQEMFYNGRYSQVKISSPNFVKLAEAYGIQAVKANNVTDAEKYIKEAFSHSNPTVMEFDITEEENVYPIVPPGGNNSETIIK